jgi:carbon storage regulator CsrA
MLGVHGNTVRLGIEAPLEVPVRRKEVQDKIDRDQRPVRLCHVELKG